MANEGHGRGSAPRSERQRVSAALTAWAREGRASATVTVVHTWGSTYRRAGACMAVSEDGTWVGTISGGCLEGDVSHVARQVIQTGVPVVVRYDLEDDDVWGLGLGCGGGVDVLVEPNRGDAMPADGDGGERASYVTATLVSNAEGLIPGGWGIPGALSLPEMKRMRIGPGDGRVEGDMGDASLTAWVEAEARRRLRDRGARSGSALFGPDGRSVPDKGTGSAEGDGMNASGERRRVFFHVVRPEPILLVLGAGPDAIPVVNLAAEAGFQVVVSDPRPAYARSERFPGAVRVLLGEPKDSPRRVALGENDYVLVMNHHKERDKEGLAAWIKEKPGYIGMLGPRRRTREILEELGLEGGDPRVYAPVGLDLGAETPEGVAISIVAELLAHKGARRGGHLRDRAGSIHQESTVAV